MNLSAEIWLASRLRRHGISVFGGLTTFEQRRERARVGIIEHALADVVAGRKDGKPETLGQLFGRVYQQPLIQVMAA